MWVYMDRRRRRRKFKATMFLRTLGFGTDESMLKHYYAFQSLDVKTSHGDERIEHLIFKDDVIDLDSQAVLARRADWTGEQDFLVGQNLQPAVHILVGHLADQRLDPGGEEALAEDAGGA